MDHVYIFTRLIKKTDSDRDLINNNTRDSLFGVKCISHNQFSGPKIKDKLNSKSCFDVEDKEDKERV